MRLARTSFAIASIAGLVTAFEITGGPWTRIADGLPDAGARTTWALQVTSGMNSVLALCVIGGLIAAGFILPTTRDTISHEGRSLSILTSRIAAVWSVVALTSAVLTLAVVLGLPESQVLRGGIVGTYIWALPTSRSFVIAALLAAVIAVWAAVVASLNSVLVLISLSAAAISAPLLNSHSAALGDHSLALTSSLVHGVSISGWVGALVAVSPSLVRGDDDVARRFSRLAVACVLLVGSSGVAAAYARLGHWQDLWGTDYGRLVLMKILAFCALLLIARTVRHRLQIADRAKFALTVELLLLGLTVGIGSALHATPPSRSGVELPSAAEQVLGFVFPPAPNAMRYLVGWHPDWLLLLVLLGAATAYVMGVVRIGIRAWPVMRLVSFLSGIAVATWATSSGIAKYAMVSFAAHMVAHMILSMVAPILLILGAPITLALRALPVHQRQDGRGPREWIVSILHSPYARLVTHPLVVLIVFTFGLYGMYFTPAFSALMSGHIGHTSMAAHFLVTGLLFSFAVIGVDPGPRQLAPWSRLLLIMVAMALHAFFAVAIMQSTNPIGNAWYRQVRPPWITNPLSDTYAGGGSAWALGEIPTLALLIIVAVQWARTDQRAAARWDRSEERTDDEQLRAYNKRLEQLNRPNRST